MDRRKFLLGLSGLPAALALLEGKGYSGSGKGYGGWTDSEGKVHEGFADYPEPKSPAKALSLEEFLPGVSEIYVGLIATIESDKKLYEIGEPVTINLRCENLSSPDFIYYGGSPLEIIHRGYPKEIEEEHWKKTAHPYADMYRYFLRDEEGNLLLGKGWGGSYPGNLWPMKPGQFFEQEINLNRYCEIGKEGKYTLTVFVVPTIHPAEREKGILSNTIGIEFKNKDN